MTRTSLLLLLTLGGGCFDYASLSRNYDGAVAPDLPPSASLTLDPPIQNTLAQPIVTALATGDFNQDHKLDLAATEQQSATSMTDTVGLYAGDGAGHFVRQQSYGVGGSPQAIVSADINADQTPDLAVATANGGDVDLILDPSIGQSQETITKQSFAQDLESLVITDFDGNGVDDLAVAAGAPGIVFVALGTMPGQFSPPVSLTAKNPNSLAAGDFDGDGRPDLAVAETDGGDVAIYLTRGANLFGASPQTYATGAQPFFVLTADLDGDGFLDFAATSLSESSISIYYGRGDGSFAAVVVLSSLGISGAFALAAGDLNGDGRLDLVATNNDGPGISVLLGAGSRRYAEAQVFTTHVQSSQWVTLADVNGDGRLDILVPGQVGLLDVFLNRS